MKNRLPLLLVALLLLAPLAHAATEATGSVFPLLAVDAMVDNQPVVCRALTFKLAGFAGALQLTIDCGGPAPIVCTVQNGTFTLTEGHLVFACHTASTTGVFRAVHLPQLITVAPGGSGTLQVQVYNSSSQPLSNLTVTASAVPACSSTRGTLAAGNVWQYSCSAVGVVKDLTDTLTVTAKTSTGATLVAGASAQVMVDGPRLALSVSPAAQVVAAGGAAAWDVKVSNDGATALTQILEADNLTASNCFVGPLATLEVGQGIAYHCTRGSIAASFIATHTAQATAPSGLLTAHQTVTVSYGDVLFKDGFEVAHIFANGFEKP